MLGGELEVALELGVGGEVLQGRDFAELAHAGFAGVTVGGKNGLHGSRRDDEGAMGFETADVAELLTVVEEGRQSPANGFLKAGNGLVNEGAQVF